MLLSLFSPCSSPNKLYCYFYKKKKNQILPGKFLLITQPAGKKVSYPSPSKSALAPLGGNNLTLPPAFSLPWRSGWFAIHQVLRWPEFKLIGTCPWKMVPSCLVPLPWMKEEGSKGRVSNKTK
jgi:hypothetical protein